MGREKKKTEKTKRTLKLNPFSAAVPFWGQFGDKSLTCSYNIVVCPQIGTAVLLREKVLNRTYGTYKHLHTSLFLLTVFGPINYGPPQSKGLSPTPTTAPVIKHDVR